MIEVRQIQRPDVLKDVFRTAAWLPASNNHQEPGHVPAFLCSTVIIENLNDLSAGVHGVLAPHSETSVKIRRNILALAYIDRDGTRTPPPSLLHSKYTTCTKYTDT